MSQVFRALSDPTRRRVLQLLRKGPMSAGEKFDVSKMSAHFRAEGGTLHAEKAGSVIYHLKLSVLEEALPGPVVWARRRPSPTSSRRFR
jgi:DNA-binding transcriptional ArsR family regulator